MKTKCPNEEILSDYMEGRISEKKRHKLEAHLSDCDQCLEQFVTVKNLVRGGEHVELEPVPEQVTLSAVRLVTGEKLTQKASFKEWVSRPVKDLYFKVADFLTHGLLGEPQPVPIRGSKKIISEDLIHLRKTFKKIDTEIEIEKTTDQKAHIRVRMHKDAGQRKGVRVTLKRGEREISSYLLNSGYVLFEDIPFGHYSLVFILKGESLGTYPFEIKESINGRK